MGQYYRAAFINDGRNSVVCAQYTSSFGQDGDWIGCKLMEHSYIGNRFVNDVAARLLNSPKRLVWAGDYGDDVVGNRNYHDLCSDFLQPLDGREAEQIVSQNTIFIDHDRKEWFDVSKQKRPSMRGWDSIIHPLPLLTADGNGRGGGDYRGPVLLDMVGIWAGDLIELSDNAPEGYAEIFPWFTEISDWTEEDDKALEERKPKRYAVTRHFRTTDTVYVDAYSENEAIELAEQMNVDQREALACNLQKDGASDVECLSDGE